MQCRVQENAALAKRGAEPGVEFDVLAYLNLLDVPHCDEARLKRLFVIGNRLFVVAEV